MSRYSFSLGVVPVQAWIAEASRSRDLRAGSTFLSWLMAKLLVHLEEVLSVDETPRIPLEPELEQGSGFFRRLAEGTFAAALAKEYSIPNRASGFCEDGKRRVEDIFPALFDEVVEPTWRAWKKDFLTSPPNSDGAATYLESLAAHRAAYEERVGQAGDCPFQVVWVVRRLDARDDGLAVRGFRGWLARFVPSWLQPSAGEEETPPEPGRDDSDDRDPLQDVHHLYSQVKRSRRIRPWKGAPEEGRGIPKCTVCGRRESSGPTAAMEDWRDFHRKNDEEGWVKHGWRIDPGERLCYVCLARRLSAYANPDGAFPSTAAVAAAPWIAAVKAAGGKVAAALETFEGAATGPVDKGDVPRALYASPRELRERDLVGVLKARDELLKAVATHRQPGAGDRSGEARLPAPEPPSYLALVAFDGDDMGGHVDEDPTGVPEKLNAFAADARECLTYPGGPAIFYLGGDEGLALLPAAGALAQVRDLRERFVTRFAEEGATLSAGLVFFEQKRPMGGALREARRLLQVAKSAPPRPGSPKGKDSLAVAVETASGSRWKLAAPWGPVWQRIAAAVEMVDTGNLASGWAYDVESFLRSMDDGSWTGVASQPELVRHEVRRLLHRRVTARAGKRAEDRRRWAEASWRGDLQGERLWEKVGSGPALRDAEQFHLIGFLARQLATAPPAGAGGGIAEPREAPE